jgi:hypothetical protein
MPVEDTKPFRWKPGQSGNPKGRPKTLVNELIKELKEEGYERVSPSQIVDVYELLFNLNEEKIRDIIADKKCSMLVRIIGKAMLSNKGTEMLERMLDRAHGKAKQNINVFEQAKLPDFSKLSNEEIRDLLNSEANDDKGSA